MEIEEIRRKLRSFCTYTEGLLLRKELERYSRKHYNPIYFASYLVFLNNNECTFKRHHPQSENHPYVWQMFSVVSQHINGDCIEECLDKAIKIEEEKDGL